MSVGFGFSTGDFIAAIELVATVIDALRDSGDSTSEYCELVRQLYALETALIQVKRLDLDESQYAEVIALRQAGAQCQRTIDDFWKKIQCYQPCLRAGGSNSRIKDGWMRIKWAMCKKDDVARFKIDLMAHTQSIELLLQTLQMAQTKISSQKGDQHQRTLLGRVQDSYFGCMQRLAVVLETVSSGIQQGKQLLEMTAKIIRINVRVFQIVLNIQDVITRIPGQVERQQPVHLIDALGRHTPFHLEFIRSAEAFLAVLKINFKDIDRGTEMIDDGKFAIQDSYTKRDIDLSSVWDACFSPGQHADMSMLFYSSGHRIECCPTCFHECNGASDVDMECPMCGMTFRFSQKWAGQCPPPKTPPFQTQDPGDESPRYSEQSLNTETNYHREEAGMHPFRRVRIRPFLELASYKRGPTSRKKRVYRCVCGLNQHKDLSIMCSGCKSWQHIKCYYPYYPARERSALRPFLPVKHCCVECERPIGMDLGKITDRQRQALEETKTIHFYIHRVDPHTYSAQLSPRALQISYIYGSDNSGPEAATGIITSV